MRTVLPIAFVLALAACHNGPRPGSPTGSKAGAYSFRINLSGRNPVEGTFIIAADSVAIATDGQACRLDTGVIPRQNLHVFNCFPPQGLDKFDVTVDSHDPYRSEWSSLQRVVKTRQVCARYTTNARGARVCAEMRTENYFEDSRTGGRLRITAADTSRH